MKKFLAILCALAMVLSFSVVAMAETEVTFDDFNTDLYDEDSGMWVTFNDTFEFLRPDWMEAYEITDDLAESNVVYMAGDENGEYLVYVTFFTEDELEGMLSGDVDADTIIAYLVEAGYEDAELVICNDIGTVVYSDTENDQLSMWIPYRDQDETDLFVITFTPASDEDFGPYILNMAATLSLVVEE